MSRALNYIGIARKAGAIEMGEEKSAALVKSGKAKLLILASDASPNAKKRAEGYVYISKTPIMEAPYTKLELSEAAGKAGCSMAAFTDIGLAGSFASALESEYGERYSGLAALLAERRGRAEKRKRKRADQSASRARGGKMYEQL